MMEARGTAGWGHIVAQTGAVASGTADNTKAIQAAIGTGHKNSGGQAVVAPGAIVSGRLWLRGHAALDIGDGAVLRTVGDIPAYPAHPLIDRKVRGPFVTPDPTGSLNVFRSSHPSAELSRY